MKFSAVFVLLPMWSNKSLRNLLIYKPPKIWPHILRSNKGTDKGMYAKYSCWSRWNVRVSEYPSVRMLMQVNLIYLIIATGIHPDSLKTAVVTPVCKSGSKSISIQSNYSPISVLPAINKFSWTDSMNFLKLVKIGDTTSTPLTVTTGILPS